MGERGVGGDCMERLQEDVTHAILGIIPQQRFPCQQLQLHPLEPFQQIDGSDHHRGLQSAALPAACHG